jgi:hydroxymethylpyrimidine/phosphomethylpyrimidine kinase
VKHVPEGIPLVVDPVMVAKGGAPLLEQAALEALKTRLIPRATLITPNLPEAELLLGHSIDTTETGMVDAVNQLLKFGSNAVLLKGGHATGEELIDVLGQRGQPSIILKTKRIHTEHTHGTGCTLASAIATGLAQGLGLEAAVRRAHAYVQAAIAAAPGLGHGHGPLGHWAAGKGIAER